MVVKGVNIAGMENTDRVRQIAQAKIDELFSLMKPPSADLFARSADARNAPISWCFLIFFRTIKNYALERFQTES